ncbi:MAG: hypothetical protein KKF89_02665 [Nanoarchaeota archaeon]|nr:hypothetical protein [Nanoarchaeota archaeon]MBU1854596.1 hypothetical protein [Nanoarchaeota archaeon]
MSVQGSSINKLHLDLSSILSEVLFHSENNPNEEFTPFLEKVYLFESHGYPILFNDRQIGTFRSVITQTEYDKMKGVLSVNNNFLYVFTEEDVEKISDVNVNLADKIRSGIDARLNHRQLQTASYVIDPNGLKNNDQERTVPLEILTTIQPVGINYKKIRPV